MALLEPVQVDQLPQSIEEFIALRDRIAGTPQGGVATMVVALLLYAEDNELGQQCLSVAVDRARLQEGSKGYDGWQLRNTNLQLVRSQLRDKAYIPRSYVRGSTPENGYQLPSLPYVFEFSDNPYSGDLVSGPCKVFISCSGASSARPVTVKKDDKGMWGASEWSSLVVGVRPPA